MGVLPATAGAAAVLLAIGAGLLSQLRLPSPVINEFASPVPDDVYPWRPSPYTGVFAKNSELAAATRLFEGKVVGSESIAFAPDGSLALLDLFGDVWVAAPSADTPGGFSLAAEPLARLGVGRALGAQYDASGALIICHTHKGLLRLPPGSSQPTTLATHVAADSPLAPGALITFANDLDIAADGTVYFSATSDVLPPRVAAGFWDIGRSFLLDFARGQARGLLLAYSPATGKVTALAEGLRFANGVALAADESYVLVAETNALRVTRVWLQGPKAGTKDVLIDRLPGSPDGVSRSAIDGGFIVALVAAVPPPLTLPLLRSPLVRTVVAWATEWVAPPIEFMGAVAKVAPDGKVVAFWTDAGGEHVQGVSSAYEREDGRLWMGNLGNGAYVSYLPVSGGGAAAAE